MRPGATRDRRASGLSLEPPRRTPPLYLRLALYTSLMVTLIMGGVTLLQQLDQLARGRAARVDLLEQAMRPLTAEIGRATTMEEVKARLSTFQQAFSRGAQSDYRLQLRNAGGEVVASSPAEGTGQTDDSASVSVPVASEALVGGQGTLVLREVDSIYQAEVARQWGSWGLHLGVTIVSIVLILLVATRMLVTKPLHRLLEGIRQMEMGYWGDVSIPSSGAWEIRWLAHRFRCVGLELKKTVGQLVTAERRALMLARSSSGGVADARRPHLDSSSPSASPETGGLSYKDLWETCRELESVNPLDASPRERSLAERVWAKDASAAGRLGDTKLRARLDDAALRVLDPDTWSRLELQLSDLREDLAGWVDAREGELKQALKAHEVPFVNISHRVKHTAGVWRKMEAKGIALSQVDDLFAFRVVVPTESDCYAALGAVHRMFEPVVGRFRDYILNPKPNGYQSLHSRVRAREGPVFEVQIRSSAMHYHAMVGPSAHWLYKAERPAPRCPKHRRSFSLRRIWAHPGHVVEPKPDVQARHRHHPAE